MQTAARTALTVAATAALALGPQPTAGADDWLVERVWTADRKGQPLRYGQAVLTGLHGQDRLFLLACDHRKDGLWVVVDLRWGREHVQLTERRDNPRLACRPQRGEGASAMKPVILPLGSSYTLRVCLHGVNRPPRNCHTQPGRTS